MVTRSTSPRRQQAAECHRALRGNVKRTRRIKPRRNDNKEGCVHDLTGGALGGLSASNEHKAPSFVLKAVTQIPSVACVSVAAPCSGGPRLPERESRLWVSLVTGQLIRDRAVSV